MSDIIIAILYFPNDPTNNKVAHQLFVAERTNQYLSLYSVSSILGKEKRVYGPEKDNYITILSPEYVENGFKVPSFIDCAKMYQVEISSSVNLSGLTQRVITDDLRQKINNKIAEMKARGRHKVYFIKEKDFCSWNPYI